MKILLSLFGLVLAAQAEAAVAPTATPTPKAFSATYYVKVQVSDNGQLAKWVYRDAAGRVPQGAEGTIARKEGESDAVFLARVKVELKDIVAKRPESWDRDLDAANSPKAKPTPFDIRTVND